jgi:cytochrome c-type biogenesis protein CcmH
MGIVTTVTGTTETDRSDWRQGRLPWIALAVVVVVALVIGATHSTPLDERHRIAALEASVKCPSCEDLSVADSSAPSAVQIRALIVSDIRSGESDGQIQQYLVSRYGPQILLRPATSGTVGLVWILPAAGLVVALGALGVVFWHRRRVGGDGDRPSDEDRQLVEEALVARAGGPSGPEVGP